MDLAKEREVNEPDWGHNGKRFRLSNSHAHLPGVVAAATILPVIGVPMSSGAMEGIDALYSIEQMPPGIPVATVGIGGARNAALLAVQILTIQDSGLSFKVKAYRTQMLKDIEAKDEALQKRLSEEN